MNKLDYLFEGFNHRAYTKKTYLLSILSIIGKGQDEKLSGIPYACHRDWENNVCYFIRPETKEKIIIDDVTPDKPLFIKNEPITVRASDSPFVTEDINTTMGRYLFNMVVLFESFKNKVTYINDEVTDNTLKDIIRQLMVDNPNEGEDLPEDKASVDACLKVTQQLDYLEGLNPVLVKASSIDVFTVHPDLIKLRDELFNDLEKKGLLNDPVSVARVIDSLVKKDAEIQYNGPSKDLFIDKSFVTDSRKKMFIVFGMDANFHDNKYKLLRKSLNEGWDLNDFSNYVNSAIDASYSRSVNVGKAGADIKVIILLTSKINAIKGDCHTPRTEPVVMTKRNFKGWIGGYHMINNVSVLITKNDLADLDGKTIHMRVPQYCQEPNGNLCSTCCGESLGKEKTRVSAIVTRLFSKFFLMEMKKMHTSGLKTKLLDLDEIIR